jgi:lysine N6-hydroxylase
VSEGTDHGRDVDVSAGAGVRVDVGRERCVGESRRVERYDVVGVGIGPFNLSLAALADDVPELRALFLDERARFAWHPGMLIPGTTLQVPFLADLVTLVDPTSRLSYLAWLRATGRLFGFYFAETFHVPRVDYDAYCRWVADSVNSCRFGSRVDALHRVGDEFEVCWTDADSGARHAVLARHVVLGIGTVPRLPAALRDGRAGELACHSADYLRRQERIDAVDDVTVLGSGQSGAEVVLDLLRRWHRPGRRLRWLTRSPGIYEMEYAKLGLEHFTPDYTRYFHGLPQAVRDAVLPGQDRLYKAASAGTINDIHAELQRVGGGVTIMPNVELRALARDDRRLHLTCRQTQQGRDFTVRTGFVVAATGYRQREPALLTPVADQLRRDAAGRPQAGLDYRVPFTDGAGPGLYLQNAELHSHGVGAPDLGLGAYRAAVILNAVAGRTVHHLPDRVAHTAFDLTVAAAHDLGIIPTPDPVSYDELADVPSDAAEEVTADATVDVAVDVTAH